MPTTERTPLLGGHHLASTSSSSKRRSLRSRLDDRLDPMACALPLGLQCFVSGLADCISFTSSKTWVAFMTGNFAQLAIAAMTYLRFLLRSWLTNSSPEQSSPFNSWSQDTNDHAEMEEAYHRVILSSVTIAGFSLGAYLASHINYPFTVQKSTRRRYVVVSCLQALATSTVILLSVLPMTKMTLEEDPILLGLLSVAMGSQSIQALSLGNKPYSTTVVFTSSLSQLVGSGVFPIFLLPKSVSSKTSAGSGNTQDDEKVRRRSITESRHQFLSIILLMAGAAVGSILVEFKSATSSPGDDGGEWKKKLKNELHFYPLLLLALVQLTTAAAWWLGAGRHRDEEEEQEDEEDS